MTLTTPRRCVTPPRNEIKNADTASPVVINSCLYEGIVTHQRELPVPHTFRYRLSMAYIDLAELDAVFNLPFLWSRRRLSLCRFRRSDYLGDPDRPLEDCVREVVLQRTGHRLTGPIRMLTQVSLGGLVFNPVTVYYCFSNNGKQLRAIVAEVTNTPWGERHSYVQLVDANETPVRFECPKEFHVSPFMSMRMTYRWRMTNPARTTSIRIENHDASGRVFAATLVLKRRELTIFNRLRSVWHFFPTPVRIATAIYWQAFRLWWKRVPFVPHPGKFSDRAETTIRKP